MKMNRNGKTMGKRLLRIALWSGVAVALAGAGVLGVQNLVGTTARAGLPTARVQKGDLDLTIFARGQSRPVRTAALVAPSVRGTLQITMLLPTGTRVQEGDVVIEFDPSEQEFNIEQNRSELLQAEQEITKARADGEVQASQDEVSLLRARFDVRRAELDVSRNELVSSIDAKKNTLNLEEAKRRLAQLEQDIQSRRVANRAGIAVQEQRRNKARLDLERAQSDLQNMQLRAPFDGLVSVKENRDATGGIFITGMVLPEYRSGDLLFPGRPIADILDTNEMEIQARVNENDRARLQEGMPVEVRLDSRPLQVYAGKVKAVSGQASRGDIFSMSSGAGRSFEVTFVLNSTDLELRPGVSAEVRVKGQTVKDVLLLPRQAVFDKEGKLVVYLRNGDRWESKEIKVLHRTESHVAIEGLALNTEVAMANPEKVSGPKEGEESGGPMMPGAPGKAGAPTKFGGPGGGGSGGGPGGGGPRGGGSR
jgi:multidrug efflux pump subunit AcrA (membrane-fusion protein)